MAWGSNDDTQRKAEAARLERERCLQRIRQQQNAAAEEKVRAKAAAQKRKRLEELKRLRKQGNEEMERLIRELNGEGGGEGAVSLPPLKRGL